MGRKTKAAEPAGSGLIARVKAAYTGRQDVSGSRSPAFTCILVSQLDDALWKGPDPDSEVVKVKEHATVRALQGVAPRDPVEGMLAAQMVATHDAAMHCFRLAHLPGQSPEIRQAELAGAVKLVRAYAALAETLERRRRPPEQVVRVERVNVESGGQAIVGSVSHPGRGGSGGKADGQSHAPDGGPPEPGSAVRGQDAGGDALPVAGGAGQAAVPDARRPRRGAGRQPERAQARGAVGRGGGVAS